MDLIFKSFKYKFPILLSLLQMLFAYTLPGTVFRNIIQYHVVLPGGNQGTLPHFTGFRKPYMIGC